MYSNDTLSKSWNSGRLEDSHTRPTGISLTPKRSSKRSVTAKQSKTPEPLSSRPRSGKVQTKYLNPNLYGNSLQDNENSQGSPTNVTKATTFLHILKTMQKFKLGPGQYYYDLSTLGGPSFHFSSEKRWPKIDHLISRPRLNFDDAKRRQEIYHDNKNVRKYSPNERMKAIKKKASLEAAKIVGIKEKKQMIYNTTKSERLLRLKDKERRYEWNRKKFELAKISETWIAIDVIVGFASIARIKMKLKYKLHLRSAKLLKKLYVICVCYGRLKRKLHKIRVKRALNVLRRMVIPMKKWLMIRRKKLAEKIVDISEWAITGDKIFSLMHAFIRIITFIQRKIRKILKRKHFSLAVKKLLWNKVEYKMYIEHCVKKYTLPQSELWKKINYEAIQGHSSIPDSIKDIVIKKVLKMRMQEYRKKLREYKEECKKISEEYEETHYKILGKVADGGPIYPLHPVPHYIISESEYRILINETLQKRLEWEPLVRKNTRRSLLRLNTIIKPQFN
ncbi:unnamed protein product [Blepharisma stoltei]|uniref:Uncharacterized protein n=1 Tax=Blepharisma stoltei TaxID=1481888 RepID=A0AAU9J0U1_9CILI|nr:unnamed protein product [Blepharisma stoltei]